MTESTMIAFSEAMESDTSGIPDLTPGYQGVKLWWSFQSVAFLYRLYLVHVDSNIRVSMKMESDNQRQLSPVSGFCTYKTSNSKSNQINVLTL